MLHDIMPGVEEQMEKEMTSAYVGFDPTADSLHIGNLVPVMLLVHWQRAGHRPIALVGGATGMVGDPSGKTAERQFLDVDTIKHNLECQKAQLEKFLDFSGENGAKVVNSGEEGAPMAAFHSVREVPRQGTRARTKGGGGSKSRRTYQS